MIDHSTDQHGSGDMAEEVRALREEVARLRQTVALLDALAHQDALTGMSNRRSFERDLDRLIGRIDRYGGGGAVLYVDVDGLKKINDNFGHRAGDEALSQVATSLARALRRSDLVARIGGDEFAILLENVGDEGARDTAERLRRSISDSEFLYEGDTLPLSVAIGVGMIRGGDTIADVMGRADADMYARKKVA